MDVAVDTRLVSSGGETSASYSYDGDGLRVTKTTGQTTLTYVWDLSGAVPLLLSDGTTSYIYDDQGLPIEQIKGQTTLYYQRDQLGSTRLLTNASGATAGTYAYDPYGNLQNHTGSSDTPLRFAGGYQDSETGFYYLRARYYDPRTAQFLSRDPLSPLTQSPYGYVGGNPLNAVDPLGACPKLICWLERHWKGAASVWNAVSDPVADVASAAYKWARANPEIIGAAIAITVCAASFGGCEVVAAVVIVGTFALDLARYQRGEIGANRFAFDVFSTALITTGVGFLPELLYLAGDSLDAAYLEIGEEFSGQYRGLLEAGSQGLEELVRLADASTPCPNTR